MKISVARLIVKFLKEAGIPYLFGLSGHSIFPITDALYSVPDLRFIPVMHELSAAYRLPPTPRARGRSVSARPQPAPG